MVKEKDQHRFPGKPEMPLPIGHIGLFVGRPADDYGNFSFEGHVIVGRVVGFEDDPDCPLRQIEVLDPPEEEFSWRTLMLDSLFEVEDDQAGARRITREKQEALWAEYQESEPYLSSF